MDDLRWHQPVYAGDTLSVTVETVEKHADENPTFGHNRAKLTTTTQRGDTVLTMYGRGLTAKRGDA